MPPFSPYTRSPSHTIARPAADNAQVTLQRVHTSGLLIVATAMLCLLSTTARAQEPDLIFSYDNPSDEMDFDLPATPDLPQVAPPAPSSDPTQEVDRFFSDAPVLDVPEEPKEGPQEEAKEEKKEPAKKKLVRQMPAKPPYNFKSVVLPGTIYKKHYDVDNRHLPVARYTSDMEYGMLASASKAKVGYMRGLKNIGTPVNLRSETGEPIVTLAARRGDLNTVHWLLIHGAESGQMSAEGLTALHYAAYRGSADMVELLLSYGADANLADTRGVTPLMYAARSGAVAAAERLLAFGADANALTSTGENAMHMAAMSRNPRMVHLLQDAGANPQQANAQGITPLQAN